MELSLRTDTVAGRDVVRVSGEVDLYTAPRLRQWLIDLVSDGATHLVVDLDQVEFLDSTGLGVLVRGRNQMRAQEGTFTLVCTQERILKIFRITGFDQVFTIVATVDDAVAATDTDQANG